MKAQHSEAIAVRRPTSPARDALKKNGVALTGEGTANRFRNKGSQTTPLGLGIIKKKERGQYPTIGGERILGVIEGSRGPDATSFKKSEATGFLAAPIAQLSLTLWRIAEGTSSKRTISPNPQRPVLAPVFLNDLAASVRDQRGRSFSRPDDFKRINDEHGHLVGSHVLMEMAAVILSSVETLMLSPVRR